MKYVSWLLKAAIFFTLFAFALNNQQDATVHFFFGTQWRAPLVLVVLTAFAAGIATGVLGMVPRWWKHREAAKRAAAAETIGARNHPAAALDASGAAATSGNPVGTFTPEAYSTQPAVDALANTYPHGV